MSCDTIRKRELWRHLNTDLDPTTLERLYQAGHRTPTGEAIVARGKAALLFSVLPGYLSAPTHSARGLPTGETLARYVTVFDAIHAPGRRAAAPAQLFSAGTFRTVEQYASAGWVAFPALAKRADGETRGASLSDDDQRALRDRLLTLLQSRPQEQWVAKPLLDLLLQPEQREFRPLTSGEQYRLARALQELGEQDQDPDLAERRVRATLRR